MTTSVPNASDRLPYGSAGTTRDGSRRPSAKVVSISTHPQWPGRTKRRRRNGSDDETAPNTMQAVRIFHEVLEQIRQRPVLSVEDESVTVAQMADRLWQRFVCEPAPIRLSRLLRSARSEQAATCIFLALFDLARVQAILLHSESNGAEILLQKNSALTG